MESSGRRETSGSRMANPVRAAPVRSTAARATAARSTPTSNTVPTALTAHVQALAPQQQGAVALAAEAKDTLVAFEDYVCDTQAKYEECAAIVKAAQSKLKFFDEERKVTVTPLNVE